MNYVETAEKSDFAIARARISLHMAPAAIYMHHLAQIRKRILSEHYSLFTDYSQYSKHIL